MPRFLVIGVAVFALGFSACSSGNSSNAATTVTTAVTTSIVDVPVSCDDVTDLFPVAVAVEASVDACADWIDISMGRAVLASTGSASVWTRHTGYGTVLIVGAVHTLGQGWFGPAGTAVDEAIVDPGGQIGVPRLFLMLPDGSGPDVLASPWFRLYNASIAAERNGNLMQDVLPREDFYVAVADAQKLDVSGPIGTPAPVVHGEVPLYDPLGATLTTPTFAEPADGAFVLLLGYPNETRALTAAVGRVLTDAEAEATVAELAALGDPEGSIAYDTEVEMIIEGASTAGMSGGPVVDRDGRLVGILVRATDVHDGAQYVRAVRMSWVATRLAAALDDLSPADQEPIRGYLEPETDR